MQVEVISKGLFSLIVDEGRKGKQRQGFSQSGPMDTIAFHWANFLAHNEDNTPCLEIMGNMSLRFSEACVIAATGRQVKLKINGSEQPVYKTTFVEKNDIVDVSSECLGCKVYLSILGQWQVSKSAGSACTVVRESLGGIHGNGQVLQDSDVIEIVLSAECNFKNLHLRELPVEKRFNYQANIPFNVIKGYQEAYFSDVCKRIFTNGIYTVSPSIDRMGYRLTGEGVASSLSTMRSEAIHIGAIQVPPDGQPIIMMRDRQTLGGYPKLGCLNPLDVSRLAQQVPGEQISFVFQDNEEARASVLLFQRQLHQLKRELA